MQGIRLESKKESKPERQLKGKEGRQASNKKESKQERKI